MTKTRLDLQELDQEMQKSWMKLGSLALILQISRENSRKLISLCVSLSKMEFLVVLPLFSPLKWLLCPLLYPRVLCASLSGWRVFAAANSNFHCSEYSLFAHWSFEAENLHCSEFVTRYSEAVFQCSELNTRCSEYLLSCFSECNHFQGFSALVRTFPWSLSSARKT